MVPMTIHRREFVKRLGGTVAAGPALSCLAGDAVASNRKPLTVAAVQFRPVLGDVRANLNKVRVLVREAFEKGANWVVLPEFFTSGLAMHECIFSAHRPLDGEPTNVLKELAKEGNAYVGGSFLARSGTDVFNTFVLACPDGTTSGHDKDFPSTIFESSVYAGGEDAEFVRTLADKGVLTRQEIVPPRQGNNAQGVFEIGGLSIGVALCWELVRYRTARRLIGIDMLLGASGWWWSDPEFGWPDNRTRRQIGEDREEQKKLIREAPRRLSRMLGVPVVHANFSGENSGFLTSKFKTRVTGRYLGESQIVDSKGRTLASMADNEGVIVADVLPGQVEPTEEIGSEDWMPEVGDRAKEVWHESGAMGRDYYLEEVRPYLDQ